MYTQPFVYLYTRRVRPSRTFYVATIIVERNERKSFLSVFMSEEIKWRRVHFDMVAYGRVQLNLIKLMLLMTR